VEDDADWLDLYYEYLKNENYSIDTARSIQQAFDLMEKNQYDSVLTDLKMIGFGNEFGGFNVLQKVKQSNPNTQVVIITAYGTQDIAFKATQQGAFDIVYKPPDADRLRVTIRGAIQAKLLLSQNQVSKQTTKSDTNNVINETAIQQTANLFGIIGNSRMMRQAFEKISYAANVDMPVLVFGEAGTGKTFIAKTIHSNSTRKNKPFSRLHSSELSRHWEAINNNMHRLTGGTFFVDDISSLGEEEGKYMNSLLQLTDKENVRLISALTTNVSEISKINYVSPLSSNTFNKISSISIFVPPLRFRKDGDDIPALIGQLVHIQLNDSGVDKKIIISEKAMKKLVNYDYPNNNVVELKGIIEKALNMAGSDSEILEEHILIRESIPQPIEAMEDVPYIFISYVQDDSAIVDQLQQDLAKSGIQTWKDRDKLYPGMRWKSEIRQAVKDGAYFIACFSRSGENRSRSYMFEELNLAIEELRMRPKNRTWFLPIKLNECEIPDWDIGGGETLHDIQYLELYGDWSKGISILASIIKKKSEK
jgi:DNA-binding NtrC family response regulator